MILGLKQELYNLSLKQFIRQESKEVLTHTQTHTHTLTHLYTHDKAGRISRSQ